MEFLLLSLNGLGRLGACAERIGFTAGKLLASYYDLIIPPERDDCDNLLKENAKTDVKSSSEGLYNHENFSLI